MKSSITRDFRKQYEALPKKVQEQAQRAFLLWKRDPFHPSLHFKRVSAKPPIYSVRIGLGHRALGMLEEGQMYWFWIGTHTEYDKLLRRL